MAGISAKNIRNIALLGHGGEGKTTLAEAILFNAKAIDRQGRVDDGNTTMDFDPEEIGKKISISLATANATFKGVKLNLIDVPGFFDFEGEFVQAMTVADCALVVTGPGGTLPVGTEKALDYCVAHKVPTMIFINGMDKENANYWDTVNAVSQKYSTKIVPLMIPLMENGKMTGYANVLEGLFYKVGAHGENGQPLPDSLKSKYDELKGVVMEKAAESDEELLMKFFDSGELSAEEMVKGMKQGVKEGAAIGVFGGSALANFGVFNLMNNLISMMPSAAEAKPVVAFDENDKPTELKPDENAPVVIRIFKTIADPFVGRLSLFKVVSGTLKSGLTLKNASKDSEEKISSIYFLKGKKQETVDAACAGDIGALAKLSNATTGDTLSEGRELRLPPIELPKPVLSMAVYAAKKGDEDKISTGIARLLDEDPTLVYENNSETHQLTLSGISDIHLDVVKSKIEAPGGDVEVKTKYGEGSTFSIRLPLTLAIIQALMVKLGDEKYAISLGSIQTIEDIPVSEIKYVHAKEVIHLRGNVIPLIRLRELLDVPGEQEEQENITVVIVSKGDKQAGLVVDSLIGQMEIVIKSLGKYININKMISGATILGDGSVALIIDANTLV